MFSALVFGFCKYQCERSEVGFRPCLTCVDAVAPGRQQQQLDPGRFWGLRKLYDEEVSHAGSAVHMTAF
jgi:hypothetical protein